MHLIEFLGIPEMEEKLLKHGGRREGAGRPKTVDAPVRRTVYLAQRHVDLINRYLRPGATFSEALRTLLDELRKENDGKRHETN